MLVRTDDEVYRVDAVWLGPPRATFPWRARYVSYGIGLLTMMLIMFVQRRLGIPLDFFSVAWALVGTVAITRLLGKKITYDRPFGQVVAQFWAEVSGPRARTAARGGAVRAEHVRVRSTRSGAQPPRRRPAARVAPSPAGTESAPAGAQRQADVVDATAIEPAAPERDAIRSPVRTAPAAVRAGRNGTRSATDDRALRVRTAPEAWASRRSRPAEPAGSWARSPKEARRGRP